MSGHMMALEEKSGAKMVRTKGNQGCVYAEVY